MKISNFKQITSIPFFSYSFSILLIFLLCNIKTKGQKDCLPPLPPPNFDNTFTTCLSNDFAFAQFYAISINIQGDYLLKVYQIDDNNDRILVFEQNFTVNDFDTFIIDPNDILQNTDVIGEFNFVATLTTDDCTSDDAFFSLNVTDRLQADILVSANDICPGERVTISVDTNENLSWNANDAEIINTNALNTEIELEPASTKYYSFIATNGVQCPLMDSILITVKELPVLSIMPSEVDFCPNPTQSSEIYINNSNNANFTWNSDDLTQGPISNIFNLLPTFNGDNFTYILTALYSNGCVQQQELYVGYTNEPEIEVTAEADSICLGDNMVLRAWGALSYSWTEDPSLSATEGADVSVNPATTTTYTVVGSTAGCFGTGSIEITVVPPPVLSLTHDGMPINSGDRIQVCPGEQVELGVSGAYRYLWSPSSLFENNTLPNQVVGSDFIIYQVVGFNELSCRSKDRPEVTVAPINFDVKIEPVSNLCLGNPILLEGTADFADDVLWTSPDGMFTTQNQLSTEFIPNQNSNAPYTVTLSAFNDACSSVSESFEISLADECEEDEDNDGFSSTEDCDDNNAAINPNQTEIPYNGLDDDCNEATKDDDLDDDGFLIIDDCDDNNTGINPGAEEIPGNGIDEDCNEGDLITSINEFVNFNINIYPNPATKFLNLQIKNIGSYDVSIFDLTGKLLLSAKNKSVIDIQTLTQGVYLLEAEAINSGNKVIKKIMVKD